MDQLASIGVEFLDRTINRIFEENRQYYENLPRQATALFSNKPTTEWAIPEIYEKHKPVRPWGLGKIYESETGIYRAAGRITRTPGLYRRTDPDTGLLTDEFMTNTNERIHSCVRVRLDLGGLDTDDKGLYQCQALLHDDMWELRQVRIKVFDPIRRDANWGTPDPQSPIDPPDSDLRWVWKYVGPRSSAPPVRTMIEENLGPYERQLLLMNTGMYRLFTGITKERFLYFQFWFLWGSHVGQSCGYAFFEMIFNSNHYPAFRSYGDNSKTYSIMIEDSARKFREVNDEPSPTRPRDFIACHIILLSHSPHGTAC